MAEWIDVKDRLPEEGERVLTLSNFGHVHDRTLKRYFNGEYYFTPDGMKPGKDILYWMPFPEPPKKEV